MIIRKQTTAFSSYGVTRAAIFVTNSEGVVQDVGNVKTACNDVSDRSNPPRTLFMDDFSQPLHPHTNTDIILRHDVSGVPPT